MAFGLTKSLDLEASSSQYAQIADGSQTGLDITGDITTEGWINLESLPGDGVQYTFTSKWNNTGNQRGPIFYFDNNVGIASTYALRWGSSADGSTFVTSAVEWVPSTGVWYHIAQAWSDTSNEVKFYVDGVQQGSAQTVSLAGQFNNTAAWQLGAVVGGSNFDGKMSLWRAWSTVRTESEIAANKCSVLGATTNLQGEWTLDDVYTDNSGNGNTLTPSGSPVFATDVTDACAAQSRAAGINSTGSFLIL